MTPPQESHPAFNLVLGPLRIVGGDFDLDAHARLAELGDADAGEDGGVVGSPLLDVLHHAAEGLGDHGVVESVEADAVDLGPALAAGVPEGEVHVGENLVDLLEEVRGDLARLGVPAAFG